MQLLDSRQWSANTELQLQDAEQPQLQVMLPSHVSGGYWLQNPGCITQAFGPGQVDFDMECLEPCTTEEGFRYMSDEEHRWSVRCIPRSGGHSGMSGGWRGVAIDHVMTTGK